MKRERTRQVVVAVVGLLYMGTLYPLFSDLWHSHWLLEMHGNDLEPMFLSFFVGLGSFLILAARKPAAHRFFIAFAATSSLLHSAVMAIETWEAWSHGVSRDYRDVLLFAVVGVVLLVVMPSKQEAEPALLN
jgi:hypothetical protein